MSAKAIIERLEKDEWVEVERWVTDTEPEGVHLDFKRRSATGDKFDDKELATVAKAMSAFANVEGGVLAFGVSTRPSAAGSDRVDKLVTFPDFERIANQVDRRIAGLTDPPVAGARVLPFEDPGNRGHGIVVVYVPDNESGPHQAAFGDGASRYFIRTSTNSTPAPHSVLAALFGRSPPPRLRLGVCRDPNGDGSLFITNEGRGVGEGTYVRFDIKDDVTNSDLFRSLTTYASGWEQRIGTQGRGQPVYPRAVAHLHLLYPQDTVRILTFGSISTLDELHVVARIDARNSMPVHADCIVTIDGGSFVRVPAIGDLP